MDKSYSQIQEAMYDNYEFIREELLQKYKIYKGLKKDVEGLFHIDIDRQFVNIVCKFVTDFLAHKMLLNVSLIDIKLFVEDTFTFDNIIRILEEGEI
jgi:hypothetical protein